MIGFIYSILAASALAHVGQSTYNSASDGFGKCSLPAGSYFHWASVGPGFFQGAQVCGGCIQVTNLANNQTTSAHVVDQCLSCGEDDINMNLPAFAAIGDPALGRLTVQWDVVRCPDVFGNIVYAWQAGSNQWFGAFQIRNHAEIVARVEYSASKSGPWIQFNRREDNYFIASGIDKPVYVKVTSISGKSVIDGNFAPLEQGGVVEGSGQF